MPVRSCHVTIRDLDSVDHTVQVTAATLYEAVALGLTALRGDDWIAGSTDGLDTVKVAVTDVPVEHAVTNFLKGIFQYYVVNEVFYCRENFRFRDHNIIGMGTRVSETELFVQNLSHIICDDVCRPKNLDEGAFISNVQEIVLNGDLSAPIVGASCPSCIEFS
ncbi:MAG TPA: hypothetical protein VMD77_00310 [Candidatus Baltobacteraceae bacterium]|nr:hypothetical protein [Candidatus Baltobacteraceae bacterium]